MTKPLQGTKPAEDDEFYIAWGRESLKNNISFLNDVLRQLLTIDVTLVAGSIVFINTKLLNSFFNIFFVFTFFGSLIAALLGIMPFGLIVDLRVPEDIRKHKTFVFTWKLKLTILAGGLLIVGFVFAFISLLVQSL